MNSSCVEESIRKNIPWSKVSEDVKQVGARLREMSILGLLCLVSTYLQISANWQFVQGV